MTLPSLVTTAVTGPRTTPAGPGAGRETFEQTVERRAAAYAPGPGLRVSRRSCQVPNPAVAPATRAAAARIDHAVMVRSNLLFAFVTVALVGSLPLLFLVPGDLGAGLGAAVGVGGTVAFLAGAALSDRHTKVQRAALSAQTPAHLSVPADVAAAFTDFCAASHRLRDQGAPDQVIARVESERPQVEQMLAEVARLHRHGAGESDAGIALRDRIVALSAQAQALVEMDRRRSHLAVATGQVEALLALPPTRFDAEAAVLADETAHLERILDSCRADVVIPASLGQAPDRPAVRPPR